MSCLNAKTMTEQACRTFQTISKVFSDTQYELCPQNVGAKPVMKKPQKPSTIGKDTVMFCNLPKSLLTQSHC